MENEAYYETKRKASQDFHNSCAEILRKGLTPAQMKKFHKETPQQASAKVKRKDDKRIQKRASTPKD